MIDLNFDWVANWKVALNVFLSAALLGGIAAIGVWATLPAGTSAKPAIVSFLLTAATALKERMSKKPVDLEFDQKLKAGTAVERRGTGG